MQETIIQIENLKKQYRLGAIGGGSLKGDLQSWWAKKKGKEDPNAKIGVASQNSEKAFWALNGINLEVHRGEALGIIGGNGAGKSTLLKILSRVTAPTEGNIKVKGRISSMLEVGTGFHAELTGRENIYMNGAILGMSRKEVENKMEDIIEFSECRQFIDTPVKRYSSGMYVKLAFAVAAYLDAEILVMDEVLAVGDVKFQKKCLGKMEDAASQQGKTVLYVSHNMSTIRQLCTRCIVLKGGKIIFDGGVEDAISVYMEREKGSLGCEYWLDNVSRPSGDHGLWVRLKKFSFVGKAMAEYSRNEKVIFELEWKAEKRIENAGIYFILLYMDSTTVGTAQTKQVWTLEAQEVGRKRFSFDISNLASGRYYFQVDFFSKNEFGNFESYDHPLQNIYFEVRDQENEESGIQWQRPAFGSIMLNNIEGCNNE